MWDPIIEGCTTSTACNYNPEAKEDDNSCIDPLGCNDWCPDDTTEVKELDCAGVCGGIQFIDCSGQCGLLVIDECGVCGGNNTFCTDCNGVINGSAYKDNCSICVGGDTGLVACTYDCTGYWGGDTEMDQCGICNGDNSTCQDCNGDINGTAYRDGCQDCVGGNTGLIECTKDCTGLLGGTSFYDNCGICVPEGDTTCIQGCDGSWDNDGNQAVLDECNICGGDNTVCAGCDGMPNSGLEIDVCGMCGGDGTCLPENCTDDNESGYCQDLSVLQILIDNNSETLNMDMDINENGVIEPLELGIQDWLDGRLIEFSCVWKIGANSQNCKLVGNIPTSIGNLTSLTILDLSNNELTGEIPSEIGNLVNLTSLRLGGNQLSGSIPSEIGNLVNLTTLSLYLNELSGEIPAEIGNLVNLTSLASGQNQLSGEIPAEIGNLVNLTHLSLYINELSGEIPAEIGNLVNLMHLFLQENQLSGIIPPEIWNLVNLYSLWLGQNQLSGEIPSEIMNLMNLSSLSLFYNELTGEIPNEICDLDLQWNYNMLFSIENNQLCPPYPSCIEDYVGEQGTSECSETVTDYDGNYYEIVQIGNQIWMAENLKVTHYNNGDEIPTGLSSGVGGEWDITTEGAYSVHSNDLANAEIYGNLYNWYAVDDERGVCPEDFHVPSDGEYKELERALGMSESEANNMEWRGTDEGSKLAGNSDLWSDGDLDNNSEFGTSGFNALPGGVRNINEGLFWDQGIGFSSWSSTEFHYTAWFRIIYYENPTIRRSVYDKGYGFSIRCVAD